MSAWPIALDDVERARERLGPTSTPTPLRSYAGARRGGRGGHPRPRQARELPAHRRLQGPERPLGAHRARAGASSGGAWWPRPAATTASGSPGPGGASARRSPSASPSATTPRRTPPCAASARGSSRRGATTTSRWRRRSGSCARRGSTSSTRRTTRRSWPARARSPSRCSRRSPGSRRSSSPWAGARRRWAASPWRGPAGRACPVYAVQAAGASAIHDAWHLGRPVSKPSARHVRGRPRHAQHLPVHVRGAARGARRASSPSTDAEIAEAVRLVLSTTHTLVEGAGAAGLAGLLKLRETLAGKTVGIVLSGANIDRETLAASWRGSCGGPAGRSPRTRSAGASSSVAPAAQRRGSARRPRPRRCSGVEAPAVRPTVTGARGQPALGRRSRRARRPAGGGRLAPSIRSAPLMWKVGSRCGADPGERLRVAAVVAADHDHHVEPALLEHAAGPRPAGPGSPSRWCRRRGSARAARPRPSGRAMAARSISWISRLSVISIVVWLARPIFCRSRSGSKPGLVASRKRSTSAAAASPPADEVADELRLGAGPSRRGSARRGG